MNINLKSHITVICIVISVLSIQNAIADSIVTKWNDAAIAAVRATNSGPTKTARALAITHTCIYDAWAAYDYQANGTQLAGSLRQPVYKRTDTNKSEAMSYAARDCLADLFPLTAQIDSFNALLTELGYDPNIASTDTSTPAGVGHVAATAVLNFRHNDGSNQLGDEVANQCVMNSSVPYSDYTCYEPVNTPTKLNEPSNWQPLPGQKFLTPHWGSVVPYSLTSGDQFRHTIPLPADYDLDRQRYNSQAKQILDITAHLTDKQKAIAEYWANGPKSETPPGHWTLLAKNVSTKHHYDLNTDVKMFFSLTNAMFDSSIVTWDAKRHFDYIRPISAIRFLSNGLKVKSWNGYVNGEAWIPYQPTTSITPPFPEYVSGHSAFSASAAETLRLFTGSDKFGAKSTIARGSSTVEPGLVPHKDIILKWATFTKAADEAGISRRYGGIHFKDGDLNSRVLGRKVAKIAWKKSLSYFQPSN